MLQNSGVNKAILLGLIYNKPEWTIINREKWLCFMLVTREVFNRQNISQEHSEYHHIRIPESIVGFDIENLREGTEAYFEGKVTTQSSIDVSGIKRYDTSIVATRFSIMKVPVNADAVEQ